MLESLLQDLRYALRRLTRSPGFAATAILTLALGIGTTTTVYSLVEGVLLRSLPFPNSDRLVDIKQVPQQYRHPGAIGGTSPFASFQTWKTATTVLDGMATYTGRDAILTGLGPATRVMAWSVSSNFLSLLGAQPMLGRGFSPEEDGPGSPPLAVLSESFWDSRLGRDPHVLGRSLTLDTIAYTIVGVVGSDFRYPADVEVWTNLGTALSGSAGAALVHQWGFWIVGRMRPGVTVERAQAALDVVSRRAWTTEPDVSDNLPVVCSLHGYLVRDVRTPLWIMLGATALVLLVACANVSILLLVRSTSNEREMGVRVALGAGRSRLARQVLTEAGLIAGAGGAVGIVLALWSTPALLDLAGSQVPRIRDVGIDGRVLLAASALSLLAGLAAGLFPAARASLLAPATWLRGVTPGTSQGWRSRPADALVVLQVTLTLVLLSGAGLLVRSFERLVHADPGFRAEGLALVELHLSGPRYATPEAMRAYATAARDRVQVLPGVADVALTTGVPLAGGAIGSVALPGLPTRPDQPWAWVSAVTPEFFSALHIPLRRGRLPSIRGEVAIDEAASRAYFQDQEPMGRSLSAAGTQGTVVGIVGDTRQESLAEAPPPHVYAAFAAAPSLYLKILVKGSGDPALLLRSVRSAVQGVDLDVPIDRAAPFSTLLEDASAPQRLYAWLLGVLAAATMALVATGMYGLVANGVARRTREIGIRIALGADRRAVLRLVVGRGLLLTVLGVGAGLGGAAASTRVLRAYLFEVRPGDPAVLSVVSGLLLLVTLLAAYLPARRAAAVDPVVALRTE